MKTFSKIGFGLGENQQHGRDLAIGKDAARQIDHLFELGFLEQERPQVGMEFHVHQAVGKHESHLSLFLQQLIPEVYKVLVGIGIVAAK